jgi:hypothetical protein
MKKCKVCKEIKDIKEYPINHRFNDNHSSTCKKCAYDKAKKRLNDKKCKSDDIKFF